MPPPYNVPTTAFLDRSHDFSKARPRRFMSVAAWMRVRPRFGSVARAHRVTRALVKIDEGKSTDVPLSVPGPLHRLGRGPNVEAATINASATHAGLISLPFDGTLNTAGAPTFQ